MSEDQFLELTQAEFTWLHELPVCGCGKPGLVYELYRGVLRSTPRPGVEFDDDWPTWEQRLAPADGNETLFYVVAYVLNDIGATEHGGGVGGAWITEKGTRLLAILDRYAESDYDAIPSYVPSVSVPGEQQP